MTAGRSLTESEIVARDTIQILRDHHSIKAMWNTEDISRVHDSELSMTDEMAERTRTPHSKIFGQVIRRCTATFVWSRGRNRFSIAMTLEFHRITANSGRWLPVVIVAVGSHPETGRDLTYSLGASTPDGERPNNYIAKFLNCYE